MSAVSSVRTFVDPVAEIRDHFELAGWILDHVFGDLVAHGRNQDIGGARGIDDLFRRHRRVVEIQPRVEQFAHAGLDRVRQFASDDDQRLFLNRHVLLS
jgi:hypothetical protein